MDGLTIREPFLVGTAKPSSVFWVMCAVLLLCFWVDSTGNLWFRQHRRMQRLDDAAGIITG